MHVNEIADWLDRTLKVADFDDVSNNGVQIASSGEAPVKSVAFAVDGSVKSVRAAAAAGAQMLIVHHGISWGGGIRRLAGGVYSVVKAAMDADLALYACHLPLDAHPTLGNNAQLAKFFGAKHVRPAFAYHGNVIGLTGTCSLVRLFDGLLSLGCSSQVDRLKSQVKQSGNLLLGICSGGAGEFAEEAKNLGCDLYLTGEASWGDVIAAENIGMPMVCAGHYATETFGVRAVAREMKRALKVKVVDLTEVEE